jgi:gliding motility-associated peptidyl-prolyl isomerase
MKHTSLFLILLVLSLAGCKLPEARRPVTQNSGSFINESIMRNRDLVAKEEAEILKLIKKDSTTEYLASNNGFWYYYNKKSNDSLKAEFPKFKDIVKFDYTIKHLNGDVIYDQSELPTKTYAMDKEELFSGLREGLKLMREGEVVTFIFPSHKAFGYYGDKNKIGPNVPIITTVSLYSIIHETNNNFKN